MATINGKTNTSVWTFKLEVSEGTPSVENNTSPVTVKVYIGRPSSAGRSYMEGAKINCAVGVTGCSNQSISYALAPSEQVWVSSGAWLHIGTTTFSAVPHNDDGSKVVTVSASFTNNVSPSSGSASGSFTLTTIARASKPSCITYPNHTQNVGEFGDTISIHMNRNSSSFTHTVRYAYGDLSGTCINAETGKAATGIETGFKWKIPLSFMDKIPAARSGSGTIYVDTYKGSTKIGTESCGFTATVPASVKPTVTMTLEDISGVDEIYGSPVKGLSKIKITVNATPAYSSPIAAYSISANGARYSTKEATTDFLTGKDSVITVSATDKRERANSDSYTMNVQDYTPPAVSALTAIRCNEDGTANKRGAYIKATFSAAISSMGSKNTAAYSIKYKKTSESESKYTEVKLTALANNYAPTNHTYIFAANAGNSYDVVVEAVDRHNGNNPASKSTKAPTAFAIFSWRGFKNSSGNKEDGAGIGKVPEKPNVLQVGWDAEFEKEVYYKGKTLLDFFYPVGSIYAAYNHTDPNTLFGGTWERIENAFLWAVDSNGTIGTKSGSKTHSHPLGASGHANIGFSWTSANSNMLVTRDKEQGFDATLAMTQLPGYGENFVSKGTRAATLGGSTDSASNMPPYVQVSMWRRTA